MSIAQEQIQCKQAAAQNLSQMAGNRNLHQRQSPNRSSPKSSSSGRFSVAMETEKLVAEADELPKAIVRRVVKDKLSQVSTEFDMNVNKDALLAFSESARIFIHYLSSTANDICKEAKRQTMNAEDVLKAIEEIEFTEFIKPLKASLEEFRQKNGGKKAEASKMKDDKNKRKVEDKSAKSGSKSKRNKGGQDQEGVSEEN